MREWKMHRYKKVIFVRISEVKILLYKEALHFTCYQRANLATIYKAGVLDYFKNITDVFKNLVRFIIRAFTYHSFVISLYVLKYSILMDILTLGTPVISKVSHQKYCSWGCLGCEGQQCYFKGNNAHLRCLNVKPLAGKFQILNTEESFENTLLWILRFFPE